MVWAEMEKLFLASRKRGTDGAYNPCTTRTIEVYQRNLRVFFNFMIEHEIYCWSKMKKLDILNFYDWMDTPEGKRVKWSKSTKLQMLRVLRTLFIWVTVDDECVELGLKDWRKVIPAIQETPRRKYIPSYNDLRKWKAGYKTSTFIGHRDYTIFMLLLGTGIRIGELCTLTSDRLLLDEGLMRVKGKEGSGPDHDGCRTVGLTEELVNVLRGYLKRATKRRKDETWGGQIFFSRYGEPSTPNGIGQAFRKHQEKFGLTDITPHTLRHAFCTYYLRGKGQMPRLMNMTGHQSMKTLAGYLHEAEMGSDENKEELERVSPLKQI